MHSTALVFDGKANLGIEITPNQKITPVKYKYIVDIIHVAQTIGEGNWTFLMQHH